MVVRGEGGEMFAVDPSGMGRREERARARVRACALRHLLALPEAGPSHAVRDPAARARPASARARSGARGQGGGGGGGRLCGARARAGALWARGARSGGLGGDGAPARRPLSPSLPH